MSVLRRKKQLSETLARALPVPLWKAEDWERELVVGSSPDQGQLSLPCFNLAKALEVSTEEAAEKVAGLPIPQVNLSRTGPYVHFRWEALQMLKELAEASPSIPFGSDRSGENRTIVLEYCSPNLSRRFGLSHIRSTLTGKALASLYRHLGYQTISINFIGDWGIPFARTVAAYQSWGNRELVRTGDPIQAAEHIAQLGERFQRDAEKHPEYVEVAQECLRKLENGDPELLTFAKELRESAVKALERDLLALGVKFDVTDFESSYVPQIPFLIESVKTKANAKYSEGNWIVEVPEVESPALIQKKDGTTLYLSRDIAASIDREKRFSFNRMIYIVSDTNRLHFRLLFGVLRALGVGSSEKLSHLAIGGHTYLPPSKAIPERDPSVREMLKDFKEALRSVVEKEKPVWLEQEELVETFSKAALAFGVLRTPKSQSSEIDVRECVRLDADDSGAYVLSCLLLCRTLEGKAKAPADLAVALYAFSPTEEILVSHLARFRLIAHETIRSGDIAVFTKYLLELTRLFRRFHQLLPINEAKNDDERKIRMLLVRLTRTALEKGLEILGIQVPGEA